MTIVELFEEIENLKDENKRLCEALKVIKKIAQHPPYDHAILNEAIKALNETPDVREKP